MQNALWLYFRESSPGTAATVSKNLDDILAKLGDLSYECEDDCPETELGYIYFGTMVTGLGNIHLCMNNLKGNADNICDTIIHEVAHYVLRANDSAGYYDDDCSESEKTVAAGSSTKLSLADSYNCFVKNWISGSATDRANAKGDLAGTNLAGITQHPPGPIDLNGPSPRKLIFYMELASGRMAIITGVSYRWVLRDPQDRSYLMTDTSGNELFEFKPAAESVLAIINSRTRSLLKERGIVNGRVLCRATSSVFGDRLFEIPVTFI
jgi:hypothetical protein